MSKREDSIIEIVKAMQTLDRAEISIHSSLSGLTKEEQTFFRNICVDINQLIDRMDNYMEINKLSD